MPLTRQQMEQVILSGGTVRYQDRMIGTLADLPTDADLAHSSPSEQQRVRDVLLAEQARIAGELAKIDHQQAAVRAAQAEKSAGPEAVVSEVATGQPAAPLALTQPVQQLVKRK